MEGEGEGGSVLPDTPELASGQEREVEYWLVHEIKFAHETAATYAKVLASVGCDTLGG